MAMSSKVAKALIAKRRAEDPATYYNLTPTEQYTDPESGETYRLGPGPTQLACLKCLEPYRLLEAGNQLGKTTHCVYECAQFARGRHPTRPWYGPVEILVVVPSRQQALTIWYDRLCQRSRIKGPAYNHPLIPAREIRKIYYHYSGSGKVPGRIELKNGSNIHFSWAGADGMWERIQGNMYDAIFRDEATGNMRLGPELLMRLSSVQSDQKKPGGGFILWSATPTLINEEYDNYKTRCKGGVEGHAHFLIKSDENPAQSAKVRELMRKAMSEEDARVRLDGTDDYKARYLIYAPYWSDERHMASEDYEPGLYDNLWIAFDPAFGRTASEVGVLCAAINKDEPTRLRIVRFYHYKGGTLSDHVDCMREWLDGRTAEAIVCDPAILKTESTGLSVYSQLCELISDSPHEVKTHRGAVLGRNRLDDGIPMVRSYLEQNQIVVNPNSPGCGAVRYGIMDYRTREESKYNEGRGVVRKRTEAVDCLRYLVTQQPTWVQRKANPRNGQHINELQVVDPEFTPDDFAKLSPEEQTHRRRLAYSAKTVARIRRRRGPFSIRRI